MVLKIAVFCVLVLGILTNGVCAQEDLPNGYPVTRNYRFFGYWGSLTDQAIHLVTSSIYAFIHSIISAFVHWWSWLMSLVPGNGAFKSRMTENLMNVIPDFFGGRSSSAMQDQLGNDAMTDDRVMSASGDAGRSSSAMQDQLGNDAMTDERVMSASGDAAPVSFQETSNSFGSDPLPESLRGQA